MDRRRNRIGRNGSQAYACTQSEIDGQGINQLQLDSVQRQIDMLEKTWKEFVTRFFDVQTLSDEIVQEFANIIKLTEALNIGDMFVQIFVRRINEQLMFIERRVILYVGIFEELTTLTDLEYTTVFKLIDETVTFQTLMKYSHQLIVSESTTLEDRFLEFNSR